VALIGCRRSSAFWRLGRPKTHHEIKDSLASIVIDGLIKYLRYHIRHPQNIWLHGTKEYRQVQNILVAIDNYESITVTSPIIMRTLELATALSSTVWLIHIVPHTHQAPFNIDSNVFRKEISKELHHEREFLHNLAQCMRERDVDATALLVQGATVRTILEESDRLNIDLIILGCHRKSMLPGVLTEFTEEGLLSKCPRPIMFVPITE
jgi:nucleotide-binding universal stress UspA family protein